MYNRLVHPLWVRSKLRFYARPNYTPFDLADADRDVVDYFTRQVAGLRSLGFEPPAYYFRRDDITRVEIHFGFLVNRSNSVMASVGAVFDLAGETTLCFLTFDNRYSEGAHVVTDNLSVPADSFLVPEGTVQTRVPGVGDPAELYALHLAVLAELKPPGTPIRCEQGREIEYLNDVDVAGVYEEQVRRGLLRYDEAQKWYTFTLRGAYRFVWCQLWPLGAIRTRRMRREERRVLAEFRAGRE